MNTNFICYEGVEDNGFRVEHTWDIARNPHVIYVWRITPGDDRLKVATIFVPAYLDIVPGAYKTMDPHNVVQQISKAWMQGTRMDPPARIVAEICKEDGYDI